MSYFIPRAIPQAFTGVLAAVLLLSVGVPQQAAAAPADEAAILGDFFSGTLEIEVSAADWTAKRYFAADHTYVESGADGPVTGTWKVQDGKICTTADRSLGLDRAQTYCNTGPGKKAGDAWRDEDPVTGNAVAFKLKAGR